MKITLELDSRNQNDNSLIRFFRGSSDGHLSVVIAGVPSSLRLEGVLEEKDYNQGSMEYCIVKVVLGS